MFEFIKIIRWQDIVDILVVTFLFYQLISIIRGTRSVQMVLGLVVLAIVLANITFVNELYFDRQITPAGLAINGGIVAVFLLGMVKIISSLLRYMREEAALARVVRHLQKGHDNPLKGVSSRSIIAQRYNIISDLGEKHARINHSALASTLLAALMVVLGNLAADLAMVAVDPRIRLGAAGDRR